MRAKQMPYELWLKAQDVLSQVDLRDKQGRLVSAQEAEGRARTALHKLEYDNHVKFTPEQVKMLTRMEWNNAVYDWQNAKVARDFNQSYKDKPEKWNQAMSYGSDIANLASIVFGAGNAGRSLFTTKRPSLYNKNGVR